MIRLRFARQQVFLFAALFSLAASELTVAAPSKTLAQTAQPLRVSESYGRVPLAFEANRGQSGPKVEFLARLGGSTLFLTHGEAVIASPGKEPLRLKLHGIDPHARIEPIDQQAGRSNYFIGNDPTKWRTNVPQFSKVKYAGVYPGIDLVFYGNQRNLEYDFVVAPGADPTRIALDVEGAVPTLDTTGDLVAGDLRFHKPVIYQTIDGQKRVITGGYSVTKKRNVGFEVGEYERSLPLVIDPVLTYSTYLGGPNGDYADGITVDSLGNAYLAGYAASPTFPTTNGVYQQKPNVLSDLFISKLSSSGNSLVWSTFLGGSGADGILTSGLYSHAVAVDPTGNVFVVADTESLDFPTVNAFQSQCGDVISGVIPCFTSVLAEISSDGTKLLYSSYLGGSVGAEAALGPGTEVSAVGLDAAGHAYVTGTTYDANFPTTANGYLPGYPGLACGSPGFLTEFDTTKSGSASVLYSSYIYDAALPNGNCWVQIASMAVDPLGRVFLAGYGPVPILGIGTGIEGFGFVAEFNPSIAGGAGLLGSYGYGEFVEPTAVATDGNGYVYVTGYEDVPCSFWLGCQLGGFQPNNPNAGGFVSKLNLITGGGDVYNSYVGGINPNPNGGPGSYGTAIAADSSGNAYITGYIPGWTPAANFPLINPIQRTAASNIAGFVMKVNPTGTTLLFSSFFNGLGGLSPASVAVDNAGAMYVTGGVYGASLPVVGAFQPLSPTTNEIPFISKISLAGASGIAFVPGAITFGSVYVGYTSAAQEVTLLAAGNQDLLLNSITASPSSYAVTSNCPPDLTGGSSCTLTLTFDPAMGGDSPGIVTIDDNAIGSPHTFAVDGIGVPTTATAAPSALHFSATAIGTPTAPQYVKITNTGAAVLTVYGATSNLPDYAVSNLCTAALKPNTFCYVKVIFTPSVDGPRTGVLTITDNAAVSSATVTLSGDGPDFSITNAPTSGSTAPGKAVNATVTLMPKADLIGPIALTCSVPPSMGLRCAMTPASVTVNGTTSATATLTVRSSATTPAATYTIYSTGNYGTGAVKHSAAYTLTVQ